MIKPAYSVSFLLSINIFVWQNVPYFLDAPRRRQRFLNVTQKMCVSYDTTVQSGVIQKGVSCTIRRIVPQNACQTSIVTHFSRNIAITPTRRDLPPVQRPALPVHTHELARNFCSFFVERSLLTGPVFGSSRKEMRVS